MCLYEQQNDAIVQLNAILNSNMKSFPQQSTLSGVAPYRPSRVLGQATRDVKSRAFLGIGSKTDIESDVQGASPPLEDKKQDNSWFSWPLASSSIGGSTDSAPSPLRTPIASTPPILSIAGGGRFFFWYLGVCKYLLEYYDLKQCTLIGASAGALISLLTACDVNLDLAVREAYRLSVENDIWNRPAGLAGIWGSIIEDWLDTLLPEDAQERVEGRVKFVVTEAGVTLRLRYLQDFKTREDVINAAMASVHIPFFLDGNATRTYKGERFLDGSLWEFLTGAPTELLRCSGNACVIDYFYDDTLEFDRLDFIKLSSYEEVKNLVKRGYGYAQRTDARGGFEGTLGVARKSALRLAVEFPYRQLYRALSSMDG